ncbi:MAG: HEAT repeat domain-containing protein [Pseudonocardiales bacterium]|nr:HEAT repeat domain-containing protein [Pseudonocardiales bacterium]
MSSSDRSLSRRNRTMPAPRAEATSARPSRVYVSSTYQDLKGCRGEIRIALRQMGLEDIAMETYTAGEERPVDRCLHDVRSVDIYLGILAWRYGFVPAGGNASITELEYRAAGEAGIPRLIFVLDDEAPWPHSATYKDRDSTQIEAFRAHVRNAHLCGSFTSKEDLCSKVAVAVHRHLQDRHGITVGADTAWEAYCNRLIQEYRRLDLEALTPPDRDEHLQIALRDVFVEPDVREDMPDAELPKELRRKLAEAADPTSSELPRGLDRKLVEQARESYQRRPALGAFDALTAPLARACVLLGDPGAGKSTLVRYLALALAEGRTPPALAALDGWRPILIELRDYVLNCGEYETFSGYLDYRKRTDGLGMEWATVESYLRDDGRALVIFDGLDEISKPRLRETVSRRIAGFAAQFPVTRVVVTSRVVGYQPRVLRDAGFVQYTVQDLGPDKIDAFLRSWYGLVLRDRQGAAETRRKWLTQAIEDSAPIRELAGNPLLLTILAIIGKHQELPRERGKVYDHAAGVLVQHWDVNKHLANEDIDADVIREDDKKELLRELATRMQEGSHGFAGNSLAEADLLQDIEGYLIKRFQYESTKATKISTAMVRQLRERNFIFARYGAGVYGFVHRALLEFFSASDIVNQFEKARTLSEDDLVEQVFVPRGEDPAWVEVLRLIAGMVDATVAARLVDGLLTSAGTSRSSMLDRRPLAAVALAAQCIAEIRNVNAAEGAAKRTLQAIIELLEPPKRSFGDDVRETHLEKTVLPAMSAVSGWPGRCAFRDWFVQTGRYATAPPAAKLGARFLAALFPKDDQVRELLHGTVRSGIPKQREAALLGLAQSWKHDPATVHLIVEGLSDEDASVRRTSLDLLGTHWPDDDRAPNLMRRAATDADADVRRRAVEALAQHATKVNGAWPAVIRALQGDGAQAVRNAAVTALASDQANPQEAMAHLLQACSDPDWEVRRSALRLMVARFAGETVVFDRVLAATRDSDEDVRQTAVELLAGWRPETPESRRAVCGAIRDADPQVRRAAVGAMAQRWHDDPEVEEALKLARTDHDGDVRVAALTAWADPISRAKEYIAILDFIVADDPVADARRAALEALVSEAAEFSGAALERAIADPDPDVRLSALRSLSSAIPQLSLFRPAVLRLCEDAVEKVRQKAVEVAARFWGDRPEVMRILHRAARCQSWQLRWAALESLAARWPDDAETWRALRRGRRDPSDSVRYTATTVMASLGQNASDRAAVVEAATTDPDVWTRRWAATLLCALTVEGNRPAEASAGCSTIREAELRAAVRSGLNEAAMSAVRAATDDPDPDVRLAAYEIVSARRDAFPDALRLITTSSRDLDPEIRLFGLAALLAAWPDDDETSGARRRGLTDPTDQIRRLALESLILNEPEAPATHHATTAAINDSDWATRLVARDTLSLRWRDMPETLMSLHAAMHHPEESVRRAVVEALRGAWPDEGLTFDALADCVGDPAPNLRVWALRSLATGWPHDSRIRALLAIARHDHDSDVATAAWELQCRAEDNWAFDDARRADLRHPDVVYRRLGAERLARPASVTDDYSDLFRLGIRDNSECVRSRIRFALVSAADERQVQSVLRTAGVHPYFAARMINIQVRVARWPNSVESRDAIRQALGDVDSVVRETALHLLIESDPEATSSFEVAVRSLTDPHGNVRSAAIRLITTYWPEEPGTLDRLVSASRDVDSGNRHAALEALVIGWPRHPVTLAALEEAETDVTLFIQDFARRTRMRLQREPPTAKAWDADSRSAARERLRRADLHLPDDPASQHTVLDLTRSTDWRIRTEALRVLARRWPDWSENNLALTRALDDDNEHVRDAAVRMLTGNFPGSSAAVSMLRHAARDPHWPNRVSAVQLLRLWRSPEAQAGLIEAARDQVINVHYTAVVGLVTGWPTDDRTWDALGWAACSSFDWLHHFAYERLSGGVSDTVPDRATLLAARRVPDLLLLATWWGEDPDAAAVLRERLQHHDLLRAASLAAVLARSGNDHVTRHLLISAAQDECPAVRRIALEGLVRIRDSTWTHAAREDPDPYLRCILLEFRSLTDKSPLFSTEIIEILRRNADSVLSGWLFNVAAVRASADLLEPAALAEATLGKSYVSPNAAEWLRWLVRVTADPPKS